MIGGTDACGGTAVGTGGGGASGKSFAEELGRSEKLAGHFLLGADSGSVVADVVVKLTDCTDLAALSFSAEMSVDTPRA